MTTLKQLAFKHKQQLFLIIIFALLSGLAIIAQAYLMVTIIDALFIKQESFQQIAFLLGALLVVLSMRTLLAYWSGKCGIQIAAKAKQYFRIRLIRKYTNHPVQAAIQGQSGQKVSVLMDTVDEIDSYFSSYIPQVIQSSIIPILLIIYIFTEHIATGIIILITAPFIPVFMMIIGFHTKDKSEEQLDKMAAFSGKFLDTLQGLTTLKLFGRAKQQKEEIKRSSLAFREATMEVLKIAFMNSLALEFISMLAIGLIALEIALRLIVFQDITFFTALLMLLLAPEFYTKLKDLGSAFHSGRSSMGAAKKIEAELARKERPVRWGKERLQTDAPPTIEFHHVSFQYGKDEFALKQIHLKINPYDKIAIVGRTGSGKTTLLHIIAGLIPQDEGEIIINGKPLAHLNEEDWFSQLSYISQDPYLYSGTFAENIAVGSNRTTDLDEVKQAARAAGIADFIEAQERGYHTPIGEAGRGLSGGEKQRLALARAFLKKPNLILFDEPTTGLDLETERILQDSIEALSKQSTMITVAHRLHTILDADQILFMENGRLKAVGTHDVLIEEHASYRDMVKQQGGKNR